MDCPEYTTLSHLVDEAILCGTHDHLPGVQGREMLNSNIEKNVLPLPMESFTVMIDQISVKIPDSVENQIIKYGQSYRIGAYSNILL